MGGRVGLGWGFRVDVNKELKCENSKKKIRGGGGRIGSDWGRLGWM